MVPGCRPHREPESSRPPIMVRTANEERDILPVLLETRERLVREGWVPGVSAVDSKGLDRPREEGEPWTLHDSFMACEPNAARFHALMFLNRVAGEFLHRWCAHPMRSEADAIGLLDKAVVALTGKPVWVCQRTLRSKTAGPDKRSRWLKPKAERGAK